MSGENVVDIAFRAGDAPAQPQSRLPLHDLRAGARAPGVSVLRSARSEGALHARARASRRTGRQLANGAETVATAIVGDRVRLTFAETQPISTYLFAFAAGQVSDRDRRARRPDVPHVPSRNRRRRRSRETATPSSTFMRRRSHGSRTTPRIPYPFGKFDFVLMPSFQFGGMEHPGAIFYNASGDPARRIGDREPDARTAPA